MRGRVLLTGATGFHGRAVLERWAVGGPPLRILVHASSPPEPRPSGFEIARGDLARPETLKGSCDGVDTVLHLASYVKDDASLCEAVNGEGTEALVREARAAGVRRLITATSTAVYGYAVHRGASEDEAIVRPVTAVSRSRARAERAVLEAGGIVLRPTFVYGAGDTHFLPVIIRTLGRFPVLINGGRARLSVVAVDDLAAVLAALADPDRTPGLSGAFHVNDGRPVSLREIVDALALSVGLKRPVLSLPLGVVGLLSRRPGMRAIQRAGLDSVRHRMFLVARDHYYDASKLWSAVPVRPGRPLPERLPEFAGWYRRFTAGAAGGERP
jgi:nucleoside-diphosphate-sugar epimerase